MGNGRFVFFSIFICVITFLLFLAGAAYANASQQQAENPNAPTGDFIVPNLTIEDINTLAKAKGELIAAQKELAAATAEKKPKVKGQKAAVDENQSIVDGLLAKYSIPKSLDEEINRINSKATTWTANYNSVDLMPEDYKKKLVGLKLPKLPTKGPAPTPNSSKVLGSCTGTPLNVRCNVFDQTDVSQCKAIGCNYNQGPLAKAGTTTATCDELGAKGKLADIACARLGCGCNGSKCISLTSGANSYTLVNCTNAGGFAGKQMDFTQITADDAWAVSILMPDIVIPPEKCYGTPNITSCSGQSTEISCDSIAGCSWHAAEPTIPMSFDWRNVGGKNYVTPVKNQGQCGDCWAFGSTAAVEGEAQAYYNNPSLLISPGVRMDLAEQDLVSCSGVGSCGGGHADMALDYFESTGVASEACFPYKATNALCSNKCANWQSSKWGISNYIPIDFDVDLIKEALVKYGPLAAGMVVYEDFYYYSGGIYSHQSGDFVGFHAVTIVGYGEYGGRTFWIVKNSWGSGWGEHGYFRIFAGDSDIDDFFIYAIESPVPPTPQQKICTDSDHDGHCYWGLADKPTNCPACDAVEDCDDSKASVYQGC